MSAQLSAVGNAAASFNANIPLAGGGFAHISAPTLQVLSNIVALLQPTEAANDTPKVQPGKPATPAAATAQAGASASQTAEPSAQPAAAAAAQGEAGNAAAAARPAEPSASTAAAQPQGESSAVSFEDVKKAFLALSSQKGRPACEKVLQLFGLGKLSEAKPEQHAQVLAEIKKASA